MQRHSPLSVGLVLACLLCWPSRSNLLAATDVTRMVFTPTVVPQNYAQPVRFEATVTDNPATVAFEYDGVDRPMFDNGTNGDLVAGDGVWTILFQPGEIVGKLTTGSVFRPFIGFCKPSAALKFNVFAEVWTPSIGMTTVRHPDAITQQTDYIVNFVVSKSELLAPSYNALANRFYAAYPDHFDFLNFVHIAGLRGNRFHVGIKNDVTGIGLSVSDSSGFYGSAGRLKGLNVFPLSSLFDTAANGFNHETGHQWINFLNGSAFAPGIPHWPKGDVATNVMGFSVGGAGGEGGTYPWIFTPNGQGGYVTAANPAPNANTATFNSMELYLMGLIPPQQVGTFFVLNNQSQNVTNGQILQPSEITQVSVNNVISAAGPRTPGSVASPHAFRVATVVLSEQPLDTYAMSFYDWFARRAEQTQQLQCAEGFSQYTCKPFYLATSGHGTMVSRIEGDLPAGNDFDGDSRTDITVYRPSNGVWLTLKSSSGFTTSNTVTWGTAIGDKPLPGDYDGDGKSDLAIWRPSTGSWYILYSSTNYTSYASVNWGVSTDMPVPGDYDGDGKTDVAVFRPSTGTWFILSSITNNTAYSSIYWGVSTDLPVPGGDYDGDGRTDVAVYRPSTGVWYILYSSTNYTTYVAINWGVSADLPLSGDYDGDGKTDVAVYRPSTGTWFILYSSAGYTTYASINWGTSADVPVPGDYDGDGKTDVGVFRPGNGSWFILKSRTNYTTYSTYNWGVSTDVLIMR